MKAALRFAQAAAARNTAQLGPDDPATLEARALVAWQTWHNGDPAAARRMFEQLAARCTRLLGPDHRQTLELRRGAVAVACDSGQQADGFQRSRTRKRLRPDPRAR